MLIAERMLTLNAVQGAVQIPVRIFAPRQSASDWACRFTIGWPEREFEMEVFGVDAFQALDIAIKTIGSFLYASDPHKEGKLVWLEAGRGYGFPVPNNLRDRLIGDDRKFF